MNNQYPNSGNLFAANNTEIFRKGTVDIDGMDYEFIITATTTKEKKARRNHTILANPKTANLVLLAG